MSWWRRSTLQISVRKAIQKILSSVLVAFFKVNIMNMQGFSLRRLRGGGGAGICSIRSRVFLRPP